jgi:YVTN family beta-propeller protein
MKKNLFFRALSVVLLSFSLNFFVTPSAQATIGDVVNVAVGSDPTSIVFSPDGHRAFVANRTGNSISVIDTVTQSVITTWNFTRSPQTLAVSPDGSKLYYTTLISASAVVEVDTATGQTLNTITSFPGSLSTSFLDMALSPNGSKIYIANQVNDEILIINTAPFTLSGSISLPANSEPIALAFSPDGQRAYVANSGLSTVTVVDAVSNTTTGNPISVGPSSYSIAVSADGSKVLVADDVDNAVRVISSSTLNVVSTISVGNMPEGVTTSPTTAKAYVSNYGSNNVSKIDLTTNTVAGSPVTVGSSPYGLKVSPDGQYLYVVNNGSNTVSIITVADPIPQPAPTPELAQTGTQLTKDSLLASASLITLGVYFVSLSLRRAHK